MNHENALSVEERIASLFQQDTILPAQFFETFRRKTPLEPEKRLMLAVLEDAVACFQKYLQARDARGQALFRDAEEWILDSHHEWLFSFDNICELLGFNPHYVRAGLLEWKKRKLAARQPARVYRFRPRRRPSLAAPRRPASRRLKAAGR
jgi:hypothetical protein